MAPGRKRGGAKGAKANNQLNLGDLVLAKVKGFPAWPAKVRLIMMFLDYALCCNLIRFRLSFVLMERNY